MEDEYPRTGKGGKETTKHPSHVHQGLLLRRHSQTCLREAVKSCSCSWLGPGGSISPPCFRRSICVATRCPGVRGLLGSSVPIINQQIILGINGHHPTQSEAFFSPSGRILKRHASIFPPLNSAGLKEVLSYWLHCYIVKLLFWISYLLSFKCLAF